MGIFKKKIKNAYDIAREVGVDEEKIKELKKGARHIEGKTMDKVLHSINRSEVDRKLEKLEVFEWYKNTDLKELRKSFGYNSQISIAKAVKVNNSEMNRFENKKFDKINTVIMKMYYFYHNDFNKSIKEEKIKKGRPKKVVEPKQDEEISKEEMMKWFEETDFLALREGKSQKDMANKIGIPQSTYCDIENHQHKKRISKQMKAVYNYFTGLEERKEKEEENVNVDLTNITIVPENIEVITDYNSIPEVPHIDNENLLNKITDLEKEVRILRRQIGLYEKLIERLP